MFDALQDGVGVGEGMLPQADNAPAEAIQLVAVGVVAADIARDFGVPITLPRLGAAVALGASMPEATVNEHCDTLHIKGEVRAAWQIVGVHPPALYARSSKQGA